VIKYNLKHHFNWLLAKTCKVTVKRLKLAETEIINQLKVVVWVLGTR